MTTPDRTHAHQEPQDGGPPGSPGRTILLENYKSLIRAYDRQNDDLKAAVDVVCAQLVSGSKVPEVGAGQTGSGNVSTREGDFGFARSGADGASGAAVNGSALDGNQEIDEDERALHVSVKRKFVEAMEVLQSTHVPKKRRGNLPKEATDLFRDWFDKHYENPYPNDDEKREMARATNTAVAQITNWFINHRKRVWKPAGGGSHNRGQAPARSADRYQGFPGPE